MRRRSDRIDDWTALANVLKALVDQPRLTLEEAERWMAAAAEVPMTADEIRAVVATVVDRLAERTEAALPELAEDLLFSTHAMVAAGVEWAQPPDLIGTHVADSRDEFMTDINSLSVDTGRIAPGYRTSDPTPDVATTDRVVFNVWPNLDELDRFHLRKVRQGTMRGDACLDSRGVMIHQFGAVCLALCHSTGREDVMLEKLLKN